MTVSVKVLWKTLTSDHRALEVHISPGNCSRESKGKCQLMYATEAKAKVAFMFLEVHLRKTDERILAWHCPLDAMTEKKLTFCTSSSCMGITQPRKTC